MASYYTPEIASMVSAYAQADLVAFGYPTWDGDPAKPWS